MLGFCVARVEDVGGVQPNDVITSAAGEVKGDVEGGYG